jgi:hypothetical protein
VNGLTEFVGSQEGALRNAIHAGLQQPATAQLELAVVRSDKSQVELKYAVAGIDKNTVLLIALLQKHAQIKVMRGENEGRTLSHVQIVSKLQRVPINSASGAANIAIPKGTDNQEVIGFLQNTTTGAITGASRVELGPEGNAGTAVKNSK